MRDFLNPTVVRHIVQALHSGRMEINESVVIVRGLTSVITVIDVLEMFEVTDGACHLQAIL